MNKGKIARLAGFVGALGISAALVAMASSTTGAYFTDSQDGNLKASSGSLQLSTTDTYMNFNGLNPGQDVTKQIGFTLSSNNTTKADIWMVFDPSLASYGQFTGSKDATYAGLTGGGMGQYGHFKVVGIQNYAFESYNLQMPADKTLGQTPYTTQTARATCHVTATGNGGSGVQHAVGGGNDIPECGVPRAIKLAQDVMPGDHGNINVTFGLTGKQETQNQKNDPNVSYQIVATQPGQSPIANNW